MSIGGKELGKCIPCEENHGAHKSERAENYGKGSMCSVQANIHNLFSLGFSKGGVRKQVARSLICVLGIFRSGYSSALNIPAGITVLMI